MIVPDDDLANVRIARDVLEDELESFPTFPMENNGGNRSGGILLELSGSEGKRIKGGVSRFDERAQSSEFCFLRRSRTGRNPGNCVFELGRGNVARWTVGVGVHGEEGRGGEIEGEEQ